MKIFVDSLPESCERCLFYGRVHKPPGNSDLLVRCGCTLLNRLMPDLDKSCCPLEPLDPTGRLGEGQAASAVEGG